MSNSYRPCTANDQSPCIRGCTGFECKAREERAKDSRMRKENQDSELATLKHQRDMLLEALKPFANEANKYDPDEGDSSQRIWDTTLMIGHLRKARVAIAAVEGGE